MNPMIEKDITEFSEGITKLVLTTAPEGGNQKYYIANVANGKVVSDITLNYFQFIISEVLVEVKPSFNRTWNLRTGTVTRLVTEVFSRVEDGSTLSYSKR